MEKIKTMNAAIVFGFIGICFVWMTLVAISTLFGDAPIAFKVCSALYLIIMLD
jgi:hypothetical protein